MTTAQSIPAELPLSGALGPDDREPVYLGLTLSAWIRIGTIAGLMVLVFWPSLRRLWYKTNPIFGEPNWGHSIVVPIVGLYYLYLNREELLRAPIRPLLAGNFTRGRIISSVAVMLSGPLVAWLGAQVMPNQASKFAIIGYALPALGLFALLLDWGLGSLLFGLLTYAYGIWPGQNDYTKDIGMVLTLFGAVLTICGWGVMKIAWFPIAFLICALPWPPLLYSQVAGPLQKLAASAAVFTLQMTGVAANQGGTKIFIGDGVTSPVRTLNVAEACAGMRSLMTFISVGAAVAFLSSRPLWQKLVITFSAIPIAILCNVMRVSGQGLLDTYVSPEWSQGFAHQFAGMVMLVPAFFMVLGVGWVLDNLFVEEVDRDPAAEARGRPDDGVLRVRKPGQGEEAT